LVLGITPPLVSRHRWYNATAGIRHRWYQGPAWGVARVAETASTGCNK
jgi:hypothetical protein